MSLISSLIILSFHFFFSLAYLLIPFKPCGTVQVKSQLHSCISRHLETLRSREVWLLEQIDLLEHLKAESLQQQLQQLHWVSPSLSHTHTLEIFSIPLICNSVGNDVLVRHGHVLSLREFAVCSVLDVLFEVCGFKDDVLSTNFLFFCCRSGASLTSSSINCKIPAAATLPARSLAAWKSKL